MSDMTNMLLMVAAIELLLAMFGLTNLPGTTLWDLMTGATDWSQLSLIDYFQLTLEGVALGGGIIVGLLYFKPDFLIFAGIANLFFSFGVGIVNLYMQISKVNKALSIIFVAPLILIYVISVLEWWRAVK